jgi:hypothetical protein
MAVSVESTKVGLEYLTNLNMWKNFLDTSVCMTETRNSKLRNYNILPHGP